MSIRSLRWLKLWKELTIFLRATLSPSTPVAAKLAMIAAMLYVIVPLDVIPDVLPVLGQVDDVTALILAGATFLRMTHAVREKLRAAQK